MNLRGPGTFAALISASAVGAVGLCVVWMLIGSPMRVGAVRASVPSDVPQAEPVPTRSLSGPPQAVERSDVTSSVPVVAATRIASLEPDIASADAESIAPATAATDQGAKPIADEEAGIRLALNAKRDAKAKAPSQYRGVTILQIGDSHTSADFFTGDLRKILQARYGDGGPGYVTAGHPHIGVRSATLKVTNSPGWTYKALQKSDNIAEFWLSGFNAVAAAEGESMTFAADHAVTFDMIEIEVVRQPGGGAIDIRLDGKVESRFDLDAPQPDPVVIRLLPNRGATDRVKQITIALTRAGSVNVSSVAIYNRHSGVIYNSVGFPGATVGIINKFDERLFASELRRINPQIVVLSFGSNEGFNDNLDLERYAQNYERAVRKIKSTLPAATIVVIAPPDGNELPTHCHDKGARGPCRRASATRTPHPSPSATTADGTQAAPELAECVWRTPPKLNSVRSVQRDVAQREGLVYWNWASIMPSECGADRWASQSPPLMAKDRLHFTTSGYKLSADQFVKTLIPVIEKVRASANALSNN